MGKDIVDMSCGLRHSGVICEQGACYMFGAGQQGQLGRGISSRGGVGVVEEREERPGREEWEDEEAEKRSETKRRRRRRKKSKKSIVRDDSLLPILNKRLTSLRAVQISCGDAHTLVTTLDHRVSEIAATSKLAKKLDAHIVLTKVGAIMKTADPAEKDKVENTSSRRKGKRTTRDKIGSTKRKKPTSKITALSGERKGIEEWLSTREERNKLEADKSKIKTPAENASERERLKHASLAFPFHSEYMELNLRDFVQEIFNGVDPENSGRIQIDTLSKAIQHNKKLVTMLESREEVSALSLLHSSGTELSSLDRLDLDRDGWLTVTELLTFAQDHGSEMREQDEERKRVEEDTRRKKEDNRKETKGQKERERQRMLSEEKKEKKRIRMLEKLKQRSACDHNEIWTGNDRSQNHQPCQPRRPTSANLRKVRDRWSRLANKKRPTSAGPYSQAATASDRRQTFSRMKELFQESYQKSMSARRQHIQMMRMNKVVEE
jgi:hypothetical protein